MIQKITMSETNSPILNDGKDIKVSFETIRVTDESKARIGSNRPSERSSEVNWGD